MAIGWLAFASFALGRGPDLYTAFSTIAAALAVFIWAPTLFVLGLFTGKEREGAHIQDDNARRRGSGSSGRWIAAGLVVAALISASAYALLRGGGSSDRIATSASTASSTPRPCDDETATATVRASVVRISTDTGVGTGIVVATDRVLTNAHVVEGASTVRVEGQSGAGDGTVIGADTTIDVAVIQVPTRGLPAVTWAETTQLHAGQRLLALGYAFDLPGEPSTTAGIFSALRTVAGVDYVQTDAPINPGNSGGPLFTQCGHVAGLNTFRLADQELNPQGVGFAIGSSVLEKAVTDLGSSVSAARPLPTAPPRPRVPASTPTAAEVPVESTTAPDAPALPNTPTPFPPPPPPLCGDSITVTAAQPVPVGHVYQVGESVVAYILVDAPGCKAVGANFDGYMLPNSPYCTYWTQFRSSDKLAQDLANIGRDGCQRGRADVFMACGCRQPLTDGAATISLTGSPAEFPPESVLYATLQGFRLCGLFVYLFQDDSGVATRTWYRHFVGDRCFYASDADGAVAP